ncbi:MAG: patatin-like phospholipase family protein [Bacteroides sp.]|jgi:NTE family protein|nr:patatin-like phospholipase family protein [Bacteroides sp.]
MPKHLFVFILFLLISLCNHAQDRKKVALVLGGGGAKGAAEVGVIKVLEEANIPIDYVVGTSIGAIVGGLYSIGYDAHDLDSLFQGQDWLFLLSDQVKRKDKNFLSKEEKDTYVLSIPFSFKKKATFPTGYVVGQNVVNLFSRLTVGYHQMDSFKKLPIPFSCVTVDILSGKEVVLSSGSLPMAMRASMSIPGAFVPVEWNDMMLIDGGVLNNFPVDIARKMGADIVIGIDLSNGWKNKDELTSIPAVLDQIISIMGREKYKVNRHAADLYIHPELKEYNATSFQPAAIDTMLIRGENAARKEWNNLIALRHTIYNGKEPSAQQYLSEKTKIVRTDSFPIKHIIFKGINKEEEEWIRRKIHLKENANIHLADIDRSLSTLQGLSIFSKVEYQLANSTPYDLIFTLEEKNDKRINIGGRFDSEDVFSVLLNVSNRQALSKGHHYALTTRIAQNPYLRVDYTYGGLYEPGIGCTYLMRYNNFDAYSYSKKIDIPDFLSQELSLYYTQSIGSFRMQLGARYAFFNYHGYFGDQQEKISPDHFINYYANFLLDTYDRKYFPERGGKVHLESILHTDNGASYDGNGPIGSILVHAETALRLSPTLCMIPAVKGRFLMGSNIPYIYRNYAGGTFDNNYLSQQIAWETVNNLHLLDNQFLATKLALRYRIKKKLYITALGEYGKEAHKFSSLYNGDDLWGYALRASYDFIIGPIALQVNYSNLYKNVGVYLNAGFQF